MKLRVKRIIFMALICLGVLGVALFRWPMRFQTDLNSLINLDSKTGWPIQDITNKFSSVINIVVQSEDKFPGEKVAHKIRNIVNSDEFPEMEIMTQNFSAHSIISTLGKYRNVMLCAADRRLLQEHKFDTIVNNARTRVESAMMSNILPLSQDPFLLFTNYVSEIGKNNNNWMPKDGILWQYKAPYNFYMLPITIEKMDGAKLAESVEQFKTKVKNLENDSVKIYMGGAPAHTAEMYNHSKIELGIISILALAAVIVLNYLLFRHIKTIFPVMTSLGVGYLAGTIALFLCFGEPHILVFVFGTSLIGLGIDYAFHFMCIEKDADITATNKNILHSLLTTLICFVPLLFANVSLLRQISVFTIVGLVAIYAFIKLFIEYRTNIVLKKSVLVRPVNKKYRPYFIIGIAAVSIIACLFARIENNMSAMYRPARDLAVSEKLIGELNASDKTAFLIVRGDDIQDVLETEEEIRDSRIQFFGVSSVIPSLKRQIENADLVKSLYAAKVKDIRRALALKNTPRFIDTPELTIYNDDIGDLTNQIHQFVFLSNGKTYSVSTVPLDTKIDNKNARIIGVAQQIQTQMESYTHETYKLLVICGIMLLGVLFILYRRRAFRYLAPPLLGGLVSLGLLSIFGMSITFFHLLGLFIVIGLGLDYAIFHINYKPNAELRPVFYSFLTSFIGFGLLAFTSFFLVAALGTILAIGIAVSYFVSLYFFRN